MAVTFIQRLYNYALLMRLHRPVGIGLLLWPTLWALWVAGQGKPRPVLVLVFTLGVLLMRSAGCVINDYADQQFDGRVRRTKDRPLVTGRISRREALGLFAVLAAGAALLLLFLNRTTVALAALGLGLAVIYPFMKRFTHWPQFFLGLAFAWGIPMAFTAQTNTVPAYGWLMFAATLLWIVAYDTVYAMVDREDDSHIGVKSTAILFGTADRLAVGLLEGGALVLLALFGWQLGFGMGYYAGLALAALLAVYQLYLIKNRVVEDCFKAFRYNNYFGLAIFLGILLNYGLG